MGTLWTSYSQTRSRGAHASDLETSATHSPDAAPCFHWREQLQDRCRKLSGFALEAKPSKPDILLLPVPVGLLEQALKVELGEKDT